MSESASPSVETPIQRVSNIELFFDLVFVFTLTQLTDTVTHPHDAGNYMRTILVFMTLMWIYGGFAWLTSNLHIERMLQFYLLFAAMAGFFVMALSIPDVFDEGGLPYALGLLVVTAVHAGLFMTAPTSGAQAILRIAPFNFASAGLVLAAAFVHPPWDWPLWAGAVAVLFAATFLRQERNFRVSPAHFVERSGLLIIIALGESIVDVGVGATGLPVDTNLVITVVPALFLAGSLWRTYFGKDDRTAEHNFTRATLTERSRMALLGYGYTHFAMILGIMLTAAGLKVAIAHPTGSADPASVWNLGAGLAVYLVGDVLFRHILRVGPGQVLLFIAGLALATISLGFLFGSLAQLVAAVLLISSLFGPSKAGLGGQIIHSTFLDKELVPNLYLYLCPNKDLSETSA